MFRSDFRKIHYSDVIMSEMTSQITRVSIVYSTVCSGAYQRKHQSSASLASVKGIHWWPVKFPHNLKGPVTRKMFPFNDVIMHIYDRTNIGEIYDRFLYASQTALLLQASDTSSLSITHNTPTTKINFGMTMNHNAFEFMQIKCTFDLHSFTICFAHIL